MKTITAVSSLLKRSLQVQVPLRKIIKSYSTGFITREFEEVQFSVPWGHVAGKWYGPKDKRPIVGLHGWQDNAGTFDTLAPLLPSDVGFLAIDLPGHGLSSWLPEGCTYHSIDYIKILFSLMRDLKWEKISLICHSMSAVNGFVFNSYFPDKCDMFVALDIVQPILSKNEITVNFAIKQFEELNKQMAISMQKTVPPSYEIEELVERLHNSTGKSISKECCKFILKRNIKPSSSSPSKYILSRDGRLKSMIFSVFSHDELVVMAKRIKCPHLFIRNNKAKHYDSELELKEIMNALKLNPSFEEHIVDGTHHLHLTEPHKIADILNPFINKYRPE
ncbi:serine hydrolase-like protein [Eupeodes corollae]|uniref:serine hydrolase-like protein n=1 Tax=Eupeodes corollae TaxID=290404 RepID=UPI002493BB49|nr:serine hydrolase-like protein [Eupeodes corollae]